MRLCIFCQEEPVYFGPLLRKLIAARSAEIVLVAIAGGRGAGGRPQSLRRRIEHLYILWLIFESRGFLRSALISGWQRLLGFYGLKGTRLDKRSIEGAAREHGIPVEKVKNFNEPRFMERLAGLAPDLIINQSELLLKGAILELPRLGIINRHGSLLPRFRGRLASFRGHAGEPPEYGITIHFVNEAVDGGPIILQKRLTPDPCLTYARVLDLVFAASFDLLLQALDLLGASDFAPLPNLYQGTGTFSFPTLAEAKVYRRSMNLRRKRRT
jgi:methionyl-tRNA formyltransferase